MTGWEMLCWQDEEKKKEKRERKKLLGLEAREGASASWAPEKPLCFLVPWAHLGVGRRQARPLGLKNIPFPRGRCPACQP